MKKILKKIVLAILISTIVGLIFFVVWANIIYKADADKLNLVLQNKNIIVVQKNSYWEIKSVTCTNEECQNGFIYYPGAKVEPQAYFYKLAELTSTKSKYHIFVTKPPLNLAFFGINQADEIIRNNQQITNWTLGGHSLGGAMSCEYAKNNTMTIKSLILFGSYCASDISKSGITVLSIHGDLDGVLNLSKLNENKKNLPIDVKDILIQGMNHAQAGNYGDQAGDQKPTIDDETLKQEILKQINLFENYY